MNVAQVTAEIMKREGTDYLLAYPLNPQTESCAAAGIRPIIVRQERTGIHMADAISRQTSGEKVGVFCQQAGPGVENSFGAVAQAWSEGVPLIVIPAGSSRKEAWIKPGFNATLNYQHITKSAEMITTPDQLVPALRRAYSQARNGRPGPCLIEVPGDMWNVDVPGTIDYVPGKAVPLGAGSGHGRQGCRRTDRRAAAAAVCGPGRALRQGLGRITQGRRVAGGPRDHQPRRQERLPGDSSAVPRIRRRRDAAGRIPACPGRRCGVRHRGRASPRRASASSSRRRTRCSSTTLWSPATSTRTSPQTIRCWVIRS